MVIRIILITLSLMISACSTSLSSIKKDHTLKDENGVFLTKLQTNHPFQLALKDSSGKIFELNKNNLDQKNKLLAVSLPRGKYTISEVSWENGVKTFSEQDSFGFLIKNGKVNYICDLGVYFKLKNEAVHNGKSGADLKFVLPVYAKQATYKEFKKNYPEISKKYPFSSSLMSKCVTGKSDKARELTTLLN